MCSLTFAKLVLTKLTLQSEKCAYALSVTVFAVFTVILNRSLVVKVFLQLLVTQKSSPINLSISSSRNVAYPLHKIQPTLLFGMLIVAQPLPRHGLS